jgi:hypothetical protein
MGTLLLTAQGDIIKNAQHQRFSTSFILVAHSRSKSMPVHAEIGMKIWGPFLWVDDPDIFFFMRGFPGLPPREPMKAQFYEGDLWKGELENMLLPMLHKYEVVVVEDPDGAISWP